MVDDKSRNKFNAKIGSTIECVCLCLCVCVKLMLHIYKISVHVKLIFDQFETNKKKLMVKIILWNYKDLNEKAIYFKDKIIFVKL